MMLDTPLFRVRAHSFGDSRAPGALAIRAPALCYFTPVALFILFSAVYFRHLRCFDCHFRHMLMPRLRFRHIFTPAAISLSPAIFLLFFVRHDTPLFTRYAYERHYCRPPTRFFLFHAMLRHATLLLRFQMMPDISPLISPAFSMPPLIDLIIIDAAIADTIISPLRCFILRDAVCRS